MSPDTSRINTFTQGPLGATLVKTALPIILVMSMNGLLAVADAVFLGLYVGPDALSAVTLMFPAYMLLAALSTLVSSGMSSILARSIGAGRIADARAVFAGAHGLACLVSALVAALFLVFGHLLTRLAAGGSVPIADMSYTYLAITAWSSPLFFLLAVNGDALRNEGRVGLMAGVSLFVSLANIGFNYLLIAVFGMGVAGAALGTTAAQVLAMVFVLVFRLRGETAFRPRSVFTQDAVSRWRSILALGAPQSLSFFGIALGSTATITATQAFAADGFETTVAAYGVITRILTFAILPLLGFCQALQAIIGNNYGAELWQRSNRALRLGLVAAFCYCLAVEGVLSQSGRPVGRLFSADPALVGEIARILPIMTAMYFASGPVLVLATYFQTIGNAGRAALLSLTKPYLFFVPLVFTLPALFGETGIWLASPVAEGLMVLVATATLAYAARNGSARWGLFVASAAG